MPPVTGELVQSNSVTGLHISIREVGDYMTFNVSIFSKSCAYKDSTKFACSKTLIKKVRNRF
jgi:hypothetical protein